MTFKKFCEVMAPRADEVAGALRHHGIYCLVRGKTVYTQGATQDALYAALGVEGYGRPVGYTEDSGATVLYDLGEGVRIQRQRVYPAEFGGDDYNDTAHAMWRSVYNTADPVVMP